MNKQLLLDPAMSSAVYTKLNEIIYGLKHDSKTANHFYHLKSRLLKNQKLTKKMQENLGWILQDLEKDLKLQKLY